MRFEFVCRLCRFVNRVEIAKGFAQRFTVECKVPGCPGTHDHG